MALPPRVVLGLAAAIVLDTVLQLLWKVAAMRLPAGGDAALLFAAAGEPVFLAVALLLALQFVNWMYVLGHADLSYAHAVVALSLVGVVVLSAVLFAEPVTWLKLCGCALVLAGVLLVGSTPPAAPKQ